MNPSATPLTELRINTYEDPFLQHQYVCLGHIQDTEKNLEAAANGEHDEWTDMYPRMSAGVLTGL